MKRRRHKKRSSNRILMLLFVLTLITAGFVVYAAGSRYRKERHIEKVELDDQTDVPMTAQSTENEETSADPESTVLTEEPTEGSTEEKTETETPTEQQLSKQRMAELLSRIPCKLARRTEIQEFHAAVLRDHDIVRTDVPVDHSGIMHL